MRVSAIAIRGRSEGDWHTSQHTQMIELRGVHSSSLTSVTKDNMIICVYEETNTT